MTATRSSDPQAFETLLRAVVRAARSGNLVAARALAQALTNEYPDHSRAWIALAGVSKTPQEQRAALQRAQALDSSDERVQRALERLSAAAVASPPAIAVTATDGILPVAPIAAVAAEPSAPPARRRSVGGWLVVLVLLLLLLPTLGYAMAVRWRQPSASEPASTPTLANSIAGAPGASPTVPTVSIGSSPTTLVTASVSATLSPSSPASTPSPQLVQSSKILPPGAMVALDGWHVSLPRQDYALLLDGGIGDVTPRGRFVLALVALANTQAQPRTLPANLFVLLDTRGRAYTPQPSLSSAYLTAYGRAQRGDLSMEDTMPSGGGYFSVPIVFDVPLDATGLRLSLGDGSVGGWDVLEAPPATPAQ